MTGKPSRNAIRITGIPPKLGNACAMTTTLSECRPRHGPALKQDCAGRSIDEAKRKRTVGAEPNA
jgi:hypothetical protein